MSGTKAGGLKARKTNLKRYGKNYYKIIGAEGGRSSNTGGFASQKIDKHGLTGHQRAVICGRLGGQKSRRYPICEVNDRARLETILNYWKYSCIPSSKYFVSKYKYIDANDLFGRALKGMKNKNYCVIDIDLYHSIKFVK